MDKKNKSIKIKKPFSKKKPKGKQTAAPVISSKSNNQNLQAEVNENILSNVPDSDSEISPRNQQNTIDKKTMSENMETTALPNGEARAKQVKKSAANNKKPKKKKNKQRRRKITLGVISALVIIGILVVGNLGTILMWLGLTDINNFGDSLTGNKKYQKLSIKSTLYENLDPNITFTNEQVINILFFGLDENEERETRYSTFRPDTIMLISINLETESIEIISIPRDSRVDIHFRSGRDKINACFYYGSLESPSSDEDFQWGVDCLVGTVSDLLGGIPIDYYVGIDMDGVPEIIDTIGGVDYYVEKQIYLEGVTIKAGQQTLSGLEFIQMARFRGYPGGDIDRVAVQQKLILALFNELTEAGNLMKLPKAISQTFDILTTNLTFNQITTLGFTVKDYDFNNLSTATMPGNYGNLYGVSYWIIDQSERVDFVYEHFGITTSRLSQDPTYIPKPAEDTPEDTTDTTDQTTDGDAITE